VKLIAVQIKYLQAVLKLLGDWGLSPTAVVDPHVTHNIKV